MTVVYLTHSPPLRTFEYKPGDDRHNTIKLGRRRLQVGRPLEITFDVVLPDGTLEAAVKARADSPSGNNGWLLVMACHQQMDQLDNGRLERSQSPVSLALRADDHGRLNWEWRLYGSKKVIQDEAPDTKEQIVFGQSVNSKTFYKGPEITGHRHPFECDPIVDGTRWRHKIVTQFGQDDGWAEIWLNGARHWARKDFCNYPPTELGADIAARESYFGQYVSEGYPQNQIIIDKPNWKYLDE